MKVLGIESSCDETAAAIVTDDRKILGQAVLTQLEHKIYGGVVPEIAARSHLEHIDEILEEKRIRHIESFIKEHPEALTITSGANPVVSKCDK